MELVKSIYQERISDIESYFELVEKVEHCIGEGGELKINSQDSYRIKPDQQKILFAGIYLHIYNLIESTILTLIDAIERHTTENINNNPLLLNEKVRLLYIKSTIDPASNISYEKKIENALNLFNQITNSNPVIFKIPKGGGGNWDVSEIKKLSENIGINIRLPKIINQKVEKPFRNDKGPIRLVKEIRNKLAHGAISFTECGDNHISSDFRELIDIIKSYLEYIIGQYEIFIEERNYLCPP